MAKPVFVKPGLRAVKDAGFLQSRPHTSTVKPRDHVPHPPKQSTDAHYVQAHAVLSTAMMASTPTDSFTKLQMPSALPDMGYMVDGMAVDGVAYHDITMLPGVLPKTYLQEPFHNLQHVHTMLAPILVNMGSLDAYHHIMRCVEQICLRQPIMTEASAIASATCVLLQMQDSFSTEARVASFIRKQWNASANVYDDGDITHYLAQLHNGCNIDLTDDAQIAVFLYPTSDMLQTIMSAPLRPKRYVVVLDDAFAADYVVRKFRQHAQVLQVPRFSHYIMDCVFTYLAQTLRFNLDHAAYLKNAANGDPRWLFNTMYFLQPKVHSETFNTNIMTLTHYNWLENARAHYLYGYTASNTWLCNAPIEDVRKVFAHAQPVGTTQSIVIRPSVKTMHSNFVPFTMSLLPTPPTQSNSALELYIHVTGPSALKTLAPQQFAQNGLAMLDALGDLMDIMSLSDTTSDIAREYMQTSAVYALRQKNNWPACTLITTAKQLDTCYFNHLRLHTHKHRPLDCTNLWKYHIPVDAGQLETMVIKYLAVAKSEQSFVFNPQTYVEWSPQTLASWLHTTTGGEPPAKQLHVHPDSSYPTKLPAPLPIAWMLAITLFYRLFTSPPTAHAVQARFNNLMRMADHLAVPKTMAAAVKQGPLPTLACPFCMHRVTEKDKQKDNKEWVCALCQQRSTSIQRVQNQVLKIT